MVAVEVRILKGLCQDISSMWFFHYKILLHTLDPIKTRLRVCVWASAHFTYCKLLPIKGQGYDFKTGKNGMEKKWLDYE
jgi:hypothetical protein